jgi:hypothetical protein
MQVALLAIAIVAELGEFATASLQVTRRHVVEHQRAVAQMLAGERMISAWSLSVALPYRRGYFCEAVPPPRKGCHPQSIASQSHRCRKA